MLGFGNTLGFLEETTEIPSMETFINTADRIRKERNTRDANGLHMHVCNNGLDSYKALGNCVLRTVVDCGDISYAQKVFSKLNYLNEFSWASIIRGHAEHGDPQQAFNLFHKMKEHHVIPSTYTFSALLKACVKLDSLERGQVLHIEIIREGWDMDPGVGSSLIDMYAKCAALADARDMLERFPARDVVLWTTLMLGYMDCGFGERALDCLEEMHADGVPPDAVAYVCSLKACISIEAIDVGRDLYTQIMKGGFESNLYVGNALVAMYAKCGLLLEAREVFDKLPCLDVVSWNTLINGYADHKYYEDALDILEKMKLEDITPTLITFIGGLKVCDGMGAVHKGRELHARIVEEGFEHYQPIGNALLGMYANSGAVLEARDIFDNLHVRDVVSWTALIAGYSEYGHEEDALNCLERMRVEGIPPEIPTYVCSLKACASLRALNLGLDLHAHIARAGFEIEIGVSNTLVDVYAKCGSLREAHAVFDSMLDRDVVSWNVLIAGYADHGFGADVLSLWNQMQHEGVSPNAITYISSLKACAVVGALEKGQRLYSEIVEEGYEGDLFVSNTIMDMYLKCGALVDAQGAFDELSCHDSITWSALLTGYAELGHGEEVLRIFEKMRREGLTPDVNSWDALILGFIEQGESDRVFEFYAQMQEHCLLPSMATFVSILNACGDIAALRIGEQVHASVYRVGFEPTCVTLANSLLDMYCGCGSTIEAQQLFEALPTRDIVTWNTLITGYSRQGKSELVFYLLNRMKKERVEPEGITFLSALMVCNHAGLVDKGEVYFEIIALEYATSSSIKHHHCMADLLGRAGQADEAAAMLGKMPFEPDLVTWGTMLGACHKAGRLKLGKQAFENAMQLDRTHTASFISMSNMFAEAYTWEE